MNRLIKALKVVLPLVVELIEIKNRIKKPVTNVTGSICLPLGKPKLTKPISFTK